MTFKEELTKRADGYIPDISERMSYIKEQLEKAYRIRHFTISLIDILSTEWTIAEGQYTDDAITLLVPDSIDPRDYMRAYVEEFRKLGFADKDMTRKVINYNNSYDEYQITLTW